MTTKSKVGIAVDVRSLQIDSEVKFIDINDPDNSEVVRMELQGIKDMHNTEGSEMKSAEIVIKSYKKDLKAMGNKREMEDGEV